MKNQVLIPSVNFHLWEPCNMRCKFCFATFQDVKKTMLPKGHLPKEQAVQVVKELAKFGFEKITFAGGEPTLCPWIDELILVAKNAGMTTMIVTNGTKLNDEFLSKNETLLDWIALSVDSINTQTNLEIGRAISGKHEFLLEGYKIIIDRIQKYDYGLKINTVINAINMNEDLSAFIQFAKPKRWKILQVMPVSGQNDGKIEDLLISNDAFESFVKRHKGVTEVTTLVPESIDLIRGSYAMVDPAGRFFDSSNGRHFYSESITSIGVKKALLQVKVDAVKFHNRNGSYQW
jgi:radical S-adenosyl methionine domain-containing protein 2